MTIYFLILLISAVSGFVQTISGFGCAVLMMLGLPYLLSIGDSASVSTAICMVLNIILVVKYGKLKSIKENWLMIVIYTAFNYISIMFIKYINVELMGILYGVFMILMALYFFLFDKKVKNVGMVFCILSALFSGIGAGIFSIGGPLLAVCFSQKYDNHSEYMSSIQLTFLFGSVMALLGRVINNVYTVNLIPYSLIGIAGVLIGQYFGGKFTNKADSKIIKTIIYGFVAVSGIITIVKYINLI